jgi:hypothetical protein
MKEKYLKIVDIVILIGVAIICVISACLDILGITEPNYSVMAFALLSAITVHFITAGFLDMDLLKKNQDLSTKLDIATKTIIDSLRGVEITLFDKIEDVDMYIAHRITVAKKSIYDLNWQDHLDKNPNPRNPVDREYNENAIDRSIKGFCLENSAKVYKEVFTFSHSRNFQKMEAHIAYGDKYSCSYYDNLLKPKFPKLQFVIIDDEEVVFVSSAYRPNFCAIKDKKIVSIFNNYFEQAWEFSDKIKEGKFLDNETFNKIKATYIKPDKKAQQAT